MQSMTPIMGAQASRGCPQVVLLSSMIPGLVSMCHPRALGPVFFCHHMEQRPLMPQATPQRQPKQPFHLLQQLLPSQQQCLPPLPRQVTRQGQHPTPGLPSRASHLLLQHSQQIHGVPKQHTPVPIPGTQWPLQATHGGQGRQARPQLS